MRIALIHYHLKPGGVTRVVSHAVEALISRGQEVIVLAGEAPSAEFPCPVQVIPALGYTMPNERIDGGALAFELRRQARAIMGGEPDIWHLHNHALGKNSAVALVASKLALDRPVVLQIHDFAEDGRPANYALLRDQLPDLSRLYPMAPQIHYAVLNGRDHGIMSKAGLPEGQLHWLPNAVSLPPGEEEQRATSEGLDGRRLILYPTRGIRRKNLGELLLHAALADPETVLGTTLRPANPHSLAIYNQWVDLSRELELPVLWELGENQTTFQTLMRSADAIITTSIAEGFGLAFLEPILFGKALCGRDLPEITEDFRQQGVELDSLYPSLPVPLDWVGRQQLRDRLNEALSSTYETYQLPLPDGAVERALQAACPEPDTVDFGCLDETMQETVIRRILKNPGERCRLTTLSFSQPDAQGQEQNLSVIRQHYSLEAYGERLMKLYETAIQSPIQIPDALPWENVLKGFLSPERFRLLRC